MLAFWRKQPEGVTEAPARQVFYTPRDYVAGGVTALIAFVVYVFTLAPGVTLQNSGELATAAYGWGVPHPPGYPSWTLLGWFWTQVFPFGNIAWRLALFSALASALAAGVAALLISKSGRVMLVQLGLSERLARLQDGEGLVLGGAVAGGLLLAFSVVLWSQAVVVEVYGLQVLCLMLVLAGLYRWSFNPEHRWRLYLAAWLWGVGITAHHTLLFLGVALLVFVYFTDQRVGRDLLAPVLVGIMGVVLVLVLRRGGVFYQGVFPMLVLLGAAVGAGGWLWRLWRIEGRMLTAWRVVLAVYGAVVLGLAFYLYLPVASATNPPMNWGYTRTWDGFIQHLTRGQDESLQVGRGPLQFWVQLNMFLGDLTVEFGVVSALLGLLVWLFVREMRPQSWDWLRFLLIGFLSLGLGLLFFYNPTLERPGLFAERVHLLPGHCIFALWVGYGLVLGSAYACGRWKWLRGATLPVAVLVAALPVVSLVRHWRECSQRGHDFGTELGYRMFRPGGDYGDMERGSVLFAGTDPGRFIATYMIFVDSQVAPAHRLRVAEDFDRRDVALITQNALVSPQYREYLRDHYTRRRPEPAKPESLLGRPGWQNFVLAIWWYGLGRENAYPLKQLWLPDETTVQQVWSDYLTQRRGGRATRDERIELAGDEVRIRGLGAVIAVNGELSRMIFERNRDTHAFYVEESYVLPWMYDYAEPYGVILRLSPDATPVLDGRVLGRDRQYWDALVHELQARSAYQADLTAQRTFAKLRSTIAGLYAHRGLLAEAEYAFRQARSLCPESFDASYRLSQLYTGLNRLDDALAVLVDYQRYDRFNPQIQQSLVGLTRMREQLAAIRELERQWSARRDDIPVALRLLTGYAQLRRHADVDSLVADLLGRDVFDAVQLREVLRLYAQADRLERAAQLLESYLQQYSNSRQGWYELAAIRATQRNCGACVAALGRALALEGERGTLRDQLEMDTRFTFCRQDPLFERFRRR